MRILIFDLDGTLVNSLPDIAGAMNHSLTACGLPPHPLEAYRLMVGNGAVKLTERACAPHREKEAEVYRRYRARYSHHLAELTHPYPGIAEALRALRAMGFTTAVISNKNQADVEQVLSHCFPDFAFDAAVGLLEGEALKPDPAPAKRMLRILHADPTDLFAVIGDSAVDVRFAKALNVPSIGCAWGFRGQAELQDAGADRIAQDADALLTVLSQM